MKVQLRPKLPPGYSLDEEGRFIHTIPIEEILEMRRTDNLILALSIGNILQALFIFFLIFAHFCNR